MFAQAQQDDFSKNFLISCLGHIFVVLIAYLSGKVIFHTFGGAAKLEIIRASVRVDVVGMPKFTIKELRELERKADLAIQAEATKGASQETRQETVDVIKPGDAVIEEKSKKKVSFLNLVTDYSEKKIASKTQVQGERNSEKSSDINSLIVEGNRLSKGSALVGDYSDAQNSEFSAYVQMLPAIIRQFWKLPSYLREQDLRCKILLFLSNEGQVLKTEMSESSGNAEYDARAEKSIRDAAPFPKPLESVGQRLVNAGIILRFPL